jgi:hypothetical protein
VEAIEAQVLDLHQYWYLDNCILIREQDHLGQAASIINTIGPPWGLMSTSHTVPRGTPS